ncbi:hypothetical protein D3C71_2230130 [compost metagenome]
MPTPVDPKKDSLPDLSWAIKSCSDFTGDVPLTKITFGTAAITPIGVISVRES